MQTKAVSVQQVSKRYPKSDVTALNVISFEVEEGEIFGLIGPDGAGKTTMFRIVTSLLLPDTGTATVFGANIGAQYKQVRNIVGYMPGRFSLYQDLTVEENLRFFATVFGTTVEANYHLIKDIYVQIEPFRKRLAGKLSGGMKQKLALSCALIHAPKLLVLDEPTTGVDSVSRKEFWDMLKRLKELGITILVATPYMDEAGLCDRVALIQKGKIMQIDTPQGITEKFGEQIFALRSQRMSQLIKDLGEYEYTKSAFLFGQDIHYIDKNTPPDTHRLQAYLAEAGHSALKINPIKATIEDCFMALM